VGLRYKSTYVIVKKSALAFGNNGKWIGKKILISGEDIRIYNFVLTALSHNLHLLEVTINSSSSSSNKYASLYHRSSNVKGRSLGTMIMGSKPRYCGCGQQLVKQNSATSERDYREMKLAGRGGVVIDHPGVVKRPRRCVCHTNERNGTGLWLLFCMKRWYALNWTILWAPPPISRRWYLRLIPCQFDIWHGCYRFIWWVRDCGGMWQRSYLINGFCDIGTRHVRWLIEPNYTLKNPWREL